MQALTRPQQFWLAAFLAVWCFFGLTGRDAWKPEESLALAPLLDWWVADAWLPSQSRFPFHTLLAGLTAWLSSPWLGIQDGARLASGFLSLAALVLTGLAGRTLYGPGFGALSALALMGCFGLMLRAHALLPETALLAGYALLLYGVALARTQVLAGAMAIALAGLALFLSRGLIDVWAVVLIVGLTMLSRDWRSRTYLRAALFGLTGMLLAMAAWLLLVWLAEGSQALATGWRELSATVTPNRSLPALLNLLSWFAWPVWPLALLTLWQEHRRLARQAALHPVLIASLITLLLGMWPSHSSGGGSLAVLPALALLASFGIPELRRGAAQGFYWFGVLCFLFFALAFWVYFAAIEWHWPTRLAEHMARLVPGYAKGITGSTLFYTAALGTLAWLVAIPLFPRAKVRPVLVWATGMALTWLLLITLFKPWAEAGWAYKPQIEAMAAHLPKGACLRSDVDPAMTTQLRLYLPEQHRKQGRCDWWLVVGPRQDFAAETWPLATVWTGFRPRDKSRFYALLHVEAGLIPHVYP